MTSLLTYTSAFGLEPSEDEGIRSEKRVCWCKINEKQNKNACIPQFLPQVKED